MLVSLTCCTSNQEKLFEAVLNNDVDKVSGILEGDIDINAMNEEGRTPLMQAVASGFERIVDLLLQNGADVMLEDAKGYNAYGLAIRNNYFDIARALIKSGDDVNEKYRIKTEHGVVLYREPDNNIEITAQIPFTEEITVKKKSRMNIEIDGSEFQWYLAEWEGKTGWLLSRHVTDRQDFLSQYFETHKKFAATYRSRVVGSNKPGSAIDEELLFLDGENCAYTRTVSFFDADVAYIHRGTYTLDFEQVRIDLKPGKQVVISYESSGQEDDGAIVDGDSFTILWNNILFGFIKEQHVPKLADDSYVLNENSHQLIRDNGSEIERIGYFHSVHIDDSSLLEAAMKGDTRALTDLIDAGFNVNVQNEAGVTPLMHAAGLRDTESVTILLRAGADTNVVSKYGRTALSAATENGRTETLRLLLAEGARPDAGRDKGATELFRAAEMGSREIARILIDAGADLTAKGMWAVAGIGSGLISIVAAAAESNHPQIVQLLAEEGGIRGELNDSDVRVRTAPDIEGAEVIAALQKGDEVIVLGRSRSEVKIGDMWGYWLAIRMNDGREGYSYGYFFDVNLVQSKIPVYEYDAK